MIQQQYRYGEDHSQEAWRRRVTDLVREKDTVLGERYRPIDHHNAATERIVDRCMPLVLNVSRPVKDASDLSTTLYDSDTDCVVVVPSPMSLYERSIVANRMSRTHIKSFYSSAAAISASFALSPHADELLRRRLGTARICLIEIAEDYLSASIVQIEAIVLPPKNSTTSMASSSTTSANKTTSNSNSSSSSSSSKQGGASAVQTPTTTSSSSSSSSSNKQQQQQSSSSSKNNGSSSPFDHSVSTIPPEALRLSEEAPRTVRVESVAGTCEIGLKELDEACLREWLRKVYVFINHRTLHQSLHHDEHEEDSIREEEEEEDGFDRWSDLNLTVREAAIRALRIYRYSGYDELSDIIGDTTPSLSTTTSSTTTTSTCSPNTSTATSTLSSSAAECSSSSASPSSFDKLFVSLVAAIDILRERQDDKDVMRQAKNVLEHALSEYGCTGIRVSTNSSSSDNSDSHSSSHSNHIQNDNTRNNSHSNSTVGVCDLLKAYIKAALSQQMRVPSSFQTNATSSSLLQSSDHRMKAIYTGVTANDPYAPLDTVVVWSECPSVLTSCLLASLDAEAILYKNDIQATKSKRHVSHAEKPNINRSFSHRTSVTASDGNKNTGDDDQHVVRNGDDGNFLCWSPNNRSSSGSFVFSRDSPWRDHDDTAVGRAAGGVEDFADAALHVDSNDDDNYLVVDVQMKKRVVPLVASSSVAAAAAACDGRGTTTNISSTTVRCGGDNDPELVGSRERFERSSSSDNEHRYTHHKQNITTTLGTDVVTIATSSTTTVATTATSATPAATALLSSSISSLRLVDNEQQQDYDSIDNTSTNPIPTVTLLAGAADVSINGPPIPLHQLTGSSDDDNDDDDGGVVIVEGGEEKRVEEASSSKVDDPASMLLFFGQLIRYTINEALKASLLPAVAAVNHTTGSTSNYTTTAAAADFETPLKHYQPAVVSERRTTTVPVPQGPHQQQLQQQQKGVKCLLFSILPLSVDQPMMMANTANTATPYHITYESPDGKLQQHASGGSNTSPGVLKVPSPFVKTAAEIILKRGGRGSDPSNNHHFFSSAATTVIQDNNSAAANTNNVTNALYSIVAAAITSGVTAATMTARAIIDPLTVNNITQASSSSKSPIGAAGGSMGLNGSSIGSGLLCPEVALWQGAGILAAASCNAIDIGAAAGTVTTQRVRVYDTITSPVGICLRRRACSSSYSKTKNEVKTMSSSLVEAVSNDPGLSSSCYSRETCTHYAHYSDDIQSHSSSSSSSCSSGVIWLFGPGPGPGPANSIIEASSDSSASTYGTATTTASGCSSSSPVPQPAAAVNTNNTNNRGSGAGAAAAVGTNGSYHQTASPSCSYSPAAAPTTRDTITLLLKTSVAVDEPLALTPVASFSSSQEGDDDDGAGRDNGNKTNQQPECVVDFIDDHDHQKVEEGVDAKAKAKRVQLSHHMSVFQCGSVAPTLSALKKLLLSPSRLLPDRFPYSHEEGERIGLTNRGIGGCSLSQSSSLPSTGDDGEENVVEIVVFQLRPDVFNIGSRAAAYHCGGRGDDNSHRHHHNMTTEEGIVVGELPANASILCTIPLPSTVPSSFNHANKDAATKASFVAATKESFVAGAVQASSSAKVCHLKDRHQHLLLLKCSFQGGLFSVEIDPTVSLDIASLDSQQPHQQQRGASTAAQEVANRSSSKSGSPDGKTVLPSFLQEDSDSGYESIYPTPTTTTRRHRHPISLLCIRKFLGKFFFFLFAVFCLVTLLCGSCYMLADKYYYPAESSWMLLYIKNSASDTIAQQLVRRRPASVTTTVAPVLPATTTSSSTTTSTMQQQWLSLSPYSPTSSYPATGTVVSTGFEAFYQKIITAAVWAGGVGRPSATRKGEEKKDEENVDDAHGLMDEIVAAVDSQLKIEKAAASLVNKDDHDDVDYGDMISERQQHENDVVCRERIFSGSKERMLFVKTEEEVPAEGESSTIRVATRLDYSSPTAADAAEAGVHGGVVSNDISKTSCSTAPGTPVAEVVAPIRRLPFDATPPRYTTASTLHVATNIPLQRTVMDIANSIGEEHQEQQRQLTEQNGVKTREGNYNTKAEEHNEEEVEKVRVFRERAQKLYKQELAKVISHENNFIDLWAL